MVVTQATFVEEYSSSACSVPWIILTVVIRAGDKQAKFGVGGVGIALRQGEGRRRTGARGIGRRQDLATTAENQ